MLYTIIKKLLLIYTPTHLFYSINILDVYISFIKFLYNNYKINQ